MKKILLAFVEMIALCSWLLGPAIGANKPPVKRGTLPAIRLPVPRDSGEKSYLGLSGGGFFQIPQIKARVIIIEIFSLYCPQCQAFAPEANVLYRMVEQVPDFRDRIKLVGIGAGNSAYEVETFKKKYDVPFPLFPDQDFSIHKRLGEVRTPYFIVIKTNKNRTHEVIYSQPGAFEEAEIFLQRILSASGLRQEN